MCVIIHNNVISVENFYWVLYQNLLRPMNIDCWYYYPFGSKDNLSLAGEFQTWEPRCEHHVLFHFDQEPLWDHDLGRLYDSPTLTWSNKIIKILANSEHSVIKKDICRDRGMPDWYFFYHGFAALDWFRDSQYIGERQPIQNAFLSLNHILTNKRSYRMSMIARLMAADCIDHGTVSFHGTSHDCEAEMQDPWCLISDRSRDLIQEHLCRNSNLPIIADSTYVDGDASAGFGHREYGMWQNSLWHVVNETVFYAAKLHLTEKIFKPIVAGRPFVLVAAPGNLAYLRSYGFQTFGQWIDESYDDEPDPDRRMDLIVQQLQRFCGLPISALRDIHRDMQPVLEHNKQHFFGRFREIITGELVDNLDQCRRIWNNGRVDGRLWHQHPDLESVKQILMQ
jgi:hypothetical protein